MSDDKIKSIGGKLGKLIRLLSSENDGEIVAAVRALQRALKIAGTDIHALAYLIEEASTSNPKIFTKDDATEIYKNGFEDGKKSVKPTVGAWKFDDTNRFHPINQTSALTIEDYHRIAVECDESGKLKESEEEFVGDMVLRSQAKINLTEKQGSWLRSIHERITGRRPRR